MARELKTVMTIPGIQVDKTLYPTIGSQVAFVRQSQEGVAEQGNGVILGLAVDATKRIVAHIRLDSKKEKVNVDVACLNPTADFVKKFAHVIEEVYKNSQEGNEVVKEVVEKCNLGIELQLDTVLGQKIDIII